MRRLVITAVLAFSLGSGLVATATSSLLTVRSVPFAPCAGIAGYAGMSADFRIVLVCTSDGEMHLIEAK